MSGLAILAVAGFALLILSALALLGREGEREQMREIAQFYSRKQQRTGRVR